MPGPDLTPVFITGDHPGEYRIPSLLLTRRGTLLAFCAHRKSVGDFGHESDVVLRRSCDGGRTWGVRFKFSRPAKGPTFTTVQ